MAANATPPPRSSSTAPPFSSASLLHSFCFLKYFCGFFYFRSLFRSFLSHVQQRPLLNFNAKCWYEPSDPGGRQTPGGGVAVQISRKLSSPRRTGKTLF